MVKYGYIPIYYYKYFARSINEYYNIVNNNFC